MASSLIGSIVERKPGPSSSSRIPHPPSKAGFPPVQHRSKSAFARAKDDQKRIGGVERLPQPPRVLPVSRPKREVLSLDDEEHQPDELGGDWRQQVAEENRRRVQNMSEAEREEERREVLERFGPGIGDILRKAKAAREAAGRPQSDRKPLRSAFSTFPSASYADSTVSTQARCRPDRRHRTSSPEAVPVPQVVPTNVYALRMSRLRTCTYTSPHRLRPRRSRLPYFRLRTPTVRPSLSESGRAERRSHS